LPVAVVSLILLVGLGLYVGVGGDDVSPADGLTSGSPPSAECTTVDMGPLTGWEDPVTVVELDATTLQGDSLYALGIGGAVWGADTNSPNDSGIILPVNEAARTYDPVTGVDVDVFQSAYADAASEAAGALAGCG
jgi:hypothetical protein